MFDDSNGTKSILKEHAFLVIDFDIPSQSIGISEFTNQDLFTINRNNIERSLDELSLKHPIFISGDYKNPSEIHELNTYLNNELNTKLFKDWQTKIGTYDAIETELSKAFSHFK